MAPKRKPSARKTDQSTQNVKKPRIPSERMADKMAAEKLNNADLHEQLQVMLEGQGEKVSDAGIIFVTVPAASSVVPLETQDPLADSQAPLDLSMISQKADGTDEPAEKVLTDAAEVIEIIEYEIREQTSTQNLFDDEQECLEDVLAAPEKQPSQQQEVAPLNTQHLFNDEQEYLEDVLATPEKQPSQQEVAPVDTQQPVNNCVLQKPVDFEIALDTVNGDDGTPQPEITTEHATLENSWEAKCKRLEGENKRLSEQLKKCKRKLATVEEEKLSSDEYALRVSKELQMLKDKQTIPQACFTEEDGIAVTVQDLEELNDRATSDSMFVGLLATRLVGAERLRQMSVTGQASHRYAKLMKPDGTPLYPTPEKMDPQILEFICNKVAERTAMRIGPQNVITIRKRSESKAVKRFIAQKIANLKKAAVVRQNRMNDCQLTPSTENVRV